MAAIAADTEKTWTRLVTFTLPSGSEYVEKARKAASNTVQFSQNLLHGAWNAGTSLLVYVRTSKADRDAHNNIVDLEGGPPSTPKALFVQKSGFLLSLFRRRCLELDKWMLYTLKCENIRIWAV